jgi:hypothetical protein
LVGGAVPLVAFGDHGPEYIEGNGAFITPAVVGAAVN